MSKKKTNKKPMARRPVGLPRLSRRTMLRGLLGGSAVAIGLPMLDIFCDENGTALAEGGAFPRRFGVWYWGNGNLPWRWR